MRRELVGLVGALMWLCLAPTPAWSVPTEGVVVETTERVVVETTERAAARPMPPRRHAPVELLPAVEPFQPHRDLLDPWRLTFGWSWLRWSWWASWLR